MKRCLWGWCLVVMTSAAVAQDGLRTARVPDVRGPSAAAAQIERAAAAQKFAFVFFWKEQTPQTDKAWAVLQAAANQMSDSMEIVAVHTADPAENAVVERFGASRAPSPLVLAVAPSGAVTKGFTGVFDEAQLRTAFVSPGTQLSLKAMQDRKLVLLCVLDQAGAGPVIVPAGVREFKADERFGSATEVVLVNGNDQKEISFLNELKVDPRSPKPFTVLLAPPGTVVGQFDGRASKDQMVAKLTTSMSSGCAGGSCGPGGCGPR
ncbi:MAG: hypothetical protein KJ000_19065 [Pirellulaceae bacterium]|nr:hypothetical protein [Pirellulaceae bacterium]